MFLQLSSDLFQQAIFQPSCQAPCAYQVHEQLQLGWGLAPECCVSG